MYHRREIRNNIESSDNAVLFYVSIALAATSKEAKKQRC